MLFLEQRQLLAPLVSLVPRHLRVRRHCRRCDRLPVAPSRVTVARCRWLRPWHLAREAHRLCLVEAVLPSPDGVLPPSIQSMKRQPAFCGLSAFCAAVCTSESSSCRSTAVLESRLTCSKLDSTSQKNSAKCLAISWRIEFL